MGRRMIEIRKNPVPSFLKKYPIYKQISILHLRWQTKNTDILYL